MYVFNCEILISDVAFSGNVLKESREEQKGFVLLKFRIMMERIIFWLGWLSDHSLTGDHFLCLLHTGVRVCSTSGNVCGLKVTNNQI